MNSAIDIKIKSKQSFVKEEGGGVFFLTGGGGGGSLAHLLAGWVLRGEVCVCVEPWQSSHTTGGVVLK